MADPSSPADVASPVVVHDDQSAVDVDVDRWARLAAAVIDDLGVTGEMSLTFVDADTIARLKGEFLGVRAATDVLAFPIDGDADPTGDVPSMLGDIVVCPEVARDQAPEHAGTFADEIALLVVHGILHLIGHDHVDDADTERMRALERRLLETHHWNGPAPAAFRQEHT